MKVRVAAFAVLAAGSLVLAGCSASGSEGASTGASKGTIKIAGVLTSSGALANNADTVFQTWQYAVDEINAAGGAGGYKFEVKRYDTDATPATSVRAATQAVTQDGAKVLTVQSSPENAALNPQLAGLDAVNISPVALDNGLIGASCAPYAFQFHQPNSQLMGALAKSMSDLKADKWAILSTDYSSGHGAADAFSAAAKKLGKKIVSEQFVPLNTTDFGSYISAIQQSGADGLMLSVYGPDADAFTNQAVQYGLNGQITSNVSVVTYQDDSLKSLGQKIEGDYIIKTYDPAEDNALNKKFIEGYTKKFGVAPNDFAASTYVGAEALFAAVAKAKTDNTADIAKALSGLKYDSIMGSVTIRDKDHQAIVPVYIAQVVKGGDGYQFKVVSSYTGAETLPAPSPECKM